MNDAVAHGADGAAIAQARAQLTVLARLQRRIADASPVGLASMRGEVTATVAATQAITLQGAPSGAQPYRTAQVALERASAAARLTTTNFVHAFYDEREFDKYLKFSSLEDEQDYRRREEEYRRAIQKALDEHTPEGDLRANKLAIEQLKDAGAHGADQSANYRPTLQGLMKTHDDLAARISTARSTAAQQERSEATSAPTSQDPKLGEAVTPEMLASVRAAKIAVADQAQEGHGLSARDPKETIARSPV